MRTCQIIRCDQHIYDPTSVLFHLQQSVIEQFSDSKQRKSHKENMEPLDFY